MKQDNGQFKSRVYQLVATIPSARVMTYGQIAALCGNPQAARIVGGFAHFGPHDLPWHRVVNKNGGLASGYYGGKVGHRKDLEQEGFTVDNDFTIDINKYMYWPGEDE